MTWKDTLKHQIFDDDAAVSAAQAPAASVAAAPPVYANTGLTAPFSSAVGATAATVSGDGAQFYDRLVAKTMPEGQPNLAKLMAIAKSLETTIPDSTLRYQAAFAVVAGQGVSREALLQEATQLVQLLDTEREKFNQTSSVRTAELATKEQQLHDLSIEVATGKTKLDEAKIGFSAAHARRARDLEALKSQLSCLK